MKQRSWFVVMTATLVLLSQSNGQRKPPTATEIFHLRTECGELAAKVLKRDFPDELDRQDSIISKGVESKYNPRTNRCTVKITFVTLSYVSVAMLDGQTNEELAWIYVDNRTGKRMATIKREPATYDEADRYIRKSMTDGRKE